MKFSDGVPEGDGKIESVFVFVVIICADESTELLFSFEGKLVLCVDVDFGDVVILLALLTVFVSKSQIQASAYLRTRSM